MVPANFQGHLVPDDGDVREVTVRDGMTNID
jgi:hypothetical protein